MSEETSTVESHESDTVRQVVSTPRKTDTPKSAGYCLKKAWHEACFKKVQDKRSHRNVLQPKPGFVSLKEFAKDLATDPAQSKMVEEWLSNKKGMLNQPRTDANISRGKLEKQATRNAKHKKKDSSKVAFPA